MSEELQNFYENFYAKSQYTGAMGTFHDFYHRKLERHHKSNAGNRILEIGAGFAEHLKFVSADFQTYVISDLNLDKKNKYLVSNLESEGLLTDNRIEFAKCDVGSLPFKNDEFDRVIVTCVLHHVSNLEVALQEIRRVTKDKGQISVYLPCDPGLLYRFVRHFASHAKQAKIMNASMTHVKYIWSLEHINHFPGILSKLRWIFKEDDLAFRGGLSRLLPFDFSIFKIIEITVSK